jgi:RimJ/RimL family protein N-acetyltransferase
MATIQLRSVTDSDLDAVFAQMRNPESVRMAAFTVEEPDDRQAFDTHIDTLRTAPDVTLRARTSDNELAGTISSFTLEGVAEVTCWIGRSLWGRGIASRALELLLREVPARPIRARAASDNDGSLRVLQKAGFQKVGTEISYANGRAAVVEETVLELTEGI